MRFLHLLGLVSVTAALPYPQEINTRRQKSCNSLEFNIQKYTAFTAGSTSPAGGPAIFGFSHLSFLFADPSFHLQYGCSAEAEKGEFLDSLVGNAYPCGGGNMSFQYFGSSITLKRTGLPCGNATLTESGSIGLSLNCFDLFGGKQCEAVTQVNVPVISIQGTS